MSSHWTNWKWEFHGFIASVVFRLICAHVLCGIENKSKSFLRRHRKYKRLSQGHSPLGQRRGGDLRLISDNDATRATAKKAERRTRQGCHSVLILKCLPIYFPELSQDDLVITSQWNPSGKGVILVLVWIHTLDHFVVFLILNDDARMPSQGETILRTIYDWRNRNNLEHPTNN